MNERRDLGIALIAATLLLFSMTQLTQCSPVARRATVDSAASATASPALGEAQRERGTTRKSIAEAAAEEEEEEREKIRGIAHALQTIGANPELRRTYGLPE